MDLHKKTDLKMIFFGNLNMRKFEVIFFKDIPKSLKCPRSDLLIQFFTQGDIYLHDFREIYGVL